MKELENANVLITGGRGKLGSTLAGALRRIGCNVAITSMDQSKAEKRAAELNAEGDGPDIIGFALNAFDLDSVERLRDSLVKTWDGRINGLITAAGGNHVPEFIEPGEKPFGGKAKEQIACVTKNLETTINTCDVIGEVMLDCDWSSIIAVGSMAGINPLPGIPGYSAGKAGVHQYTTAMAQLIAMYRPGMKHRINTLAFGFAIGDQNRDMLTNADGTWKPRGGAIASMHPDGNWGAMSDCIGPVKLLLNPVEGEGTHGSVVTVDRGFQSMGLPRYGNMAVNVGDA